MSCNCTRNKVSHSEENRLKKRSVKKRNEERARRLEMLKKMWEDAGKGS